MTTNKLKYGTEISLIAYDKGDTSVGINPVSFNIDYIILEDAEHRELVRTAFKEAFETLFTDSFDLCFSDELPEY